jgi:CheY-like chemotaxis protein
VVLMDMRMPELDGHEATRRLKANPATKDIPVIAVTASSFRDQEERARAICDGFIRKPFNRAELVAVLKRFLKPAAFSSPGSATPAGTESAATDAGSAKLPSDWPAMIEQLRAEQAGEWAELCQTLELEPVEALGLRLQALGERHGAGQLQRYGQALFEQAQRFDLDQLPRTLQSFPAVIEQLAARATAAPTP